MHIYRNLHFRLTAFNAQHQRRVSLHTSVARQVPYSGWELAEQRWRSSRPAHGSPATLEAQWGTPAASTSTVPCSHPPADASYPSLNPPAGTSLFLFTSAGGPFPPLTLLHVSLPFFPLQRAVYLSLLVPTCFPSFLILLEAILILASHSYGQLLFLSSHMQAIRLPSVYRHQTFPSLP